MKTFLGFTLALASLLTGAAQAAGLVRIADGDCAALSNAAATSAASIYLASNGNYAACPMQVTGNVTIDGNGARLAVPAAFFTDTSQVTIAAGAHLTLRNVELTDGSRPATKTGKASALPGPATIVNQGTLLLDSVAMPKQQIDFGYVALGASTNHLFDNKGTLILRNVTLDNVVDLDSHASGGLLNGMVEISHSTIVYPSGGNVWLIGSGPVSVGNSVIINGSGPICSPGVSRANFVSRGGKAELADDREALTWRSARECLTNLRMPAPVKCASSDRRSWQVTCLTITGSATHLHDSRSEDGRPAAKCRV